MIALLRRDLALAVRAGGGAGLGLAFFGTVLLLVPLGVGGDPEVLAGVAPGLVWLAALLASLLSLDRLFQEDAEDGTLDILALTPMPLTATVAVKALAHWATAGLPILLAAPLAGLTLGLGGSEIGRLALALGLGTPALSLMGAVGASLVLGLRRGGLLLSVLTLPLYMPTLIFGARAATGDPGAMLLVAATSLLAAVIAPPAAAAALRLHLAA